jgi:hypothetical protein
MRATKLSLCSFSKCYLTGGTDAASKSPNNALLSHVISVCIKIKAAIVRLLALFKNKQKSKYLNKSINSI